ncbi:NADPH-dependent FMN reductase [Cellulomonas chengniuliangii]|uniref:NAD(P)H-dependent oxidoreductase n=1 Tax=Cellulomonas chengniuliangii TaxID=2968084 RepID=A0ABY5KZL7_9CELL|nr:NADPH-dependent FMN reductase [Cellulomonas chengniuliangii]MCC2307984.1 NAD(P)H-dependent oxidoreductase [Cellulomonas chengniuliangii]MCC2318504.1 NAD(P)H-dependent oxidoreductase [Cellulomonas chengniuliangii]UUI75268.1 NAD(P)H-dependent oxidoreductase [Cellulomonas chengniuliangii]
MADLIVGCLVGSLAQGSLNRLLAEALAARAPEGVKIAEIPIGDLPMFNRDLEADYPRVAVTFKEALAACDALLFITPEHNRSIPAVLKNAIDFASRPKGTNALAHLPAAILGASPGPIGTAAAQAHLRSILPALDVVLMGQPEMYLQVTPASFDATGAPEDALAARLDEFLDTFVAFARRHHA